MMEPASSDSDSSSSDEEGGIERAPSSRKVGIAHGRVASKRQHSDDDSDSDSSSDDEEHSDDDSSDHDRRELQRGKSKDKQVRFRDGNGESESDDDDGPDYSSSGSEESDDDVKEKLSLKERLQRQELKRGSASIVGSLKDRRERRIQAVPIAKERIRAMMRQSEAKDNNKRKTNNVDYNTEIANKKKKPSKHAPTEVSSRRRQRVTLNEAGIGIEIGKNRYKARDPRVSSLSGHLNTQQFDHNYGFLQDMRQSEIKMLKHKLKTLQKTGKKAQRERKKLGIVSNNDTKESLEDELKALQQQQALQQKQQLERDAKRAFKQKLQERVSEHGSKSVYYPKRQEKKQMLLQAKMEQIKKTKGKQGVDKFVAKRVSREKSKHAKRMRVSGVDE